MSEQVLYNMGSSPLNGPAVLVMLALGAAAIGCVWLYIRQRRAGTLKPETRVVLLLTALCLGGTAVVAAVSVIPDLAQPPVVERGRVLKVYIKMVDPENDVTETHVSLSNGSDVVIPEVLGGRLQPGACVELTHTPATDYAFVARQLAPDACLGAQ
jgi:hypothetical protein